MKFWTLLLTSIVIANTATASDVELTGANYQINFKDRASMNVVVKYDHVWYDCNTVYAHFAMSQKENSDDSFKMDVRVGATRMYCPQNEARHRTFLEKRVLDRTSQRNTIYVETASGIEIAAAKSLAGETLCRTVISDGSFGQPVGEREHCLTFSDSKIEDNGSTFFGNAPESFEYMVFKNIVYVKHDKEGWLKKYSIVGGRLIDEKGVRFNAKL